MRRLDGCPATGDMFGKTFQFLGFLLDYRLYGIRAYAPRYFLKKY